MPQFKFYLIDMLAKALWGCKQMTDQIQPVTSCSSVNDVLKSCIVRLKRSFHMMALAAQRTRM
jgi:hypothetical protein